MLDTLDIFIIDPAPFDTRMAVRDAFILHVLLAGDVSAQAADAIGKGFDLGEAVTRRVGGAHAAAQGVLAFGARAVHDVAVVLAQALEVLGLATGRRIFLGGA